MEFKTITSRNIPLIIRAMVVQKKGTDLELLWLKPKCLLPTGSDVLI